MTSKDGEGTPMEEERVNEMIRQALTESRTPPAPPLDEMWNVIERRAFDDAPRRAMSVAIPASWSRWTTPALVAAAAMLIGVGLGWSIAPRGTIVTRFVTSPPPASSVATSQNSLANEPAGQTVAAAPQSSARKASVAASPEQPRTGRTRATPEIAVGSTPANTTAQLASRMEDVGGSDMSRYLVHTAALLASLPSDRATTATDTTIANRAGALLIQTHLLLDSRAGSDPTLHKLLEDLELVLAQVARLSVQRSGSDLQLIHQAIAVRDVLPRVHDATVEASITD
jgi:hypothetical protein